MIPRALRLAQPVRLVPVSFRRSLSSSSLRYSSELARKKPDTTASPRFRYSGFSPNQSFAISFLTIFGAGALGYALSSLLESQGVHLFSSAPPKNTPLDLDPKDESVTGPGTFRPVHGSKKAYDAAIVALRASFQKKGKEDNVSTDEDDLRSHGINDWSYHGSHPASVVVWAESIEDVKEVVDISRKFKVPITPYSGGTSLEGHFSSPYAGISLDMSRMDRILQINEADGDVVVEPGVKWEDLNAELKKKGIPLFFPLDPGPGATIGGMMSTGCSGTNAVRYGTMRGEWVLNATVMLPNGDIIKTRQRSRKSSAGWDTTKMFIGAEGTLGIILQATLKLAPLLPTRVAVVSFDTGVEAAVRAATETVTAGLPIQCVEFLDALTMKAINQGGLAGREFKEKDTLFFKLQGSDRSMGEIAETLQAITKKQGGIGFEFAGSDAEAEAAWQGRKAALWSVQALKENGRVWTTDVCVPISKLPQLVRETSEDAVRRGLLACHFGHVGDGNVHSLFVFQNDEELEEIKDAVHVMVERAIALDGTSSGEHGAGMGKAEFLKPELGEETVRLMHTIKRTIDPDNLFNPGKIYVDIKPTQRE
ncbi:putative D-lactate dehydrogenase cytochrome oxidoreductase protein [Filobasidium floriforme]|uniref:putative D-lactate dehydrogenase cytochrome oxidoreductase protein n=1 Tax=Filobasidium floriforme TaxID=5210 RepID=UPI001E8D4F6A|nr:putative D-lactate dehydrogenase cytochrome oxidoreductase protein [Filobasidium floriforme]KAH8086977.1 putative D-lactate dehydrogenase cytochrome oxidoreductase protein [Filobasidium floriforme]